MAQHTLLLVDPDTQHSRVMEVSLRKSGYQVITARDGADALAKIDNANPDLIISDTRMPNLSGLELCQRLKSNQHASIPFVFLTIDNSIETKVKGLEAGADDYLIRPIYTRELAARVALILEKRTQEQLKSPSEQQHYFGDLEKMGVVDLLQAMEMGRKSGMLLIRRATDKGTLWFRDGVLLDASTGALQGESAVYRMLTWDKGRFEIDFTPPRRPPSVGKSSTELIEEGMGQVDAWSDISKQLPPLDSVLAVDYTELAARIEELPAQVNEFIRLFDGVSTIRNAIYMSSMNDLVALETTSQLYFEGLITVGDQIQPDAVNQPIPDYQTSAPPSIQPTVADALLQSVEDLTGRPIASKPETEHQSTQSGANAVNASQVATTAAFLSQRQVTKETDAPKAEAPIEVPQGPIVEPADEQMAHLPAIDQTTPNSPVPGTEPATSQSTGPSSIPEVENSLLTDDAAMSDSASAVPAASNAQILETSSQGSKQVVEDSPTPENDPLSGAQYGLSNEPAEDVFPEFESGATLSEEDEDSFFTSDLGFGPSSTPPQDDGFNTDFGEDETEEPQGIPRLALLFAVLIVVGGCAFAFLRDTVEPLTIPRNSLNENWVKDELKKAAVTGPIAAIDAGWAIPSEPDGGVIFKTTPVVVDAGVVPQPDAAKAPATEKPPVQDVKKSPVVEKKPPEEASPTEPDSSKQKKANGLTLDAVKLHKKRKYGAAAKKFEAALALSPNSRPTLIGYTKTLLELGRLKTALTYAEKAARIAPNNAEIFLILGNARQDLGMKAKAIKAYERYLKLAPSGKYSSELRQVIKGMKAAPN
ncbi:MAG: response regulator [Myxococcota bacterium]|nr:response regulator [Myxococcota bacterium]